MDDTKHQLTPHGSPAVQEDMGHVPSLDEFFADVEANIAARKLLKQPKYNPHTELKKQIKAAVKRMAKYGSRPYVQSNFTGAIEVGEGKKKRRYKVGNDGAADVQCTWFGHGFMFEAKTGGGVQRHSQKRAQRLFEAAGGTYVVCRHAHEATDAMLQWAAQTGRVF